MTNSQLHSHSSAEDESSPRQRTVLMDYAFQLLSRRAYTRHTLRMKLRARLWSMVSEAMKSEAEMTSKVSKASMKPLSSTAAMGADEGSPYPEDESVLKDRQDALLDSVLDRLTELGYLNDLHYCERWVEERSRLRPRGRKLLNRELRYKGVDQETLDRFWEGDVGRRFDEHELAFRVADKQFRRLSKRLAQIYPLRQKLYRHLVSRGFSGETIQATLDKILTPH